MANDERAQMTPFLCWPEDLLPDLDIECERLESISAAEVGGAVITAVRCDVSGPFKLSDLGVVYASFEPVWGASSLRRGDAPEPSRLSQRAK